MERSDHPGPEGSLKIEEGSILLRRFNLGFDIQNVNPNYLLILFTEVVSDKYCRQ